MLSACRWVISRGTACSSCSLGSWRQKKKKKEGRKHSQYWIFFFWNWASHWGGKKSRKSYLASEDHDILDGISLQHWELINYNENDMKKIHIFVCKWQNIYTISQNLRISKLIASLSSSWLQRNKCEETVVSHRHWHIKMWSISSFLTIEGF